MSFGKNRALPGKVRLVHLKSRAARVSAAQHIAESFDSDVFHDSLSRLVPIRHRADFLPSMALADVDSGPAPSSQLELPLHLVPGDGDGAAAASHSLCAASSPGDFSLEDSGTALLKLEKAGSQESPKTAVLEGPSPSTRAPTIPSQKRATAFNPAALLPKGRRHSGLNSDSRFTPSGFLRGCAFGSAVAALILLAAYAFYALWV